VLEVLDRREADAFMKGKTVDQVASKGLMPDEFSLLRIRFTDGTYVELSPHADNAGEAVILAGAGG
jgi:hypothetical protein